MLDLASGLMALQPTGRVRCGSQDPFLLAAADTSRSKDRRRRFRLALSHVSNASAAIENGRLQHAAASLLAAHYQSEGFIELSETYCSLVIDKAQIFGGETDA